MSGNYYVRQAQALEATVAEYQEQVQLLEARNTSLRQLEANLLLSVSSFSSLNLWKGCGPGGSQQTSSGSTSSGSAGAPPADATEAHIQNLLRRVSGGGDVPLYSASLLERLNADPRRVASHLALSQQQRVAYFAASVSKLGLLLPKYDHSGPATSAGSARARLDALVDELSERLLTYALCDPRHLLADDCLINIETGQHEHYPENWWQQVIQAMELTADQKAALLTTWKRVKPMQTQLRVEHSRLANRLSRIQTQQQQHQRQFEWQAEQLLQAQEQQQEQQLARELLCEIQHMQLDSQTRSPEAAPLTVDAIEQQLVDSLYTSHLEQQQTPSTSDVSCFHPGAAGAAPAPAGGQTQQAATSSSLLAPPQAQSCGGDGGSAAVTQLQQAFLQCLSAPGHLEHSAGGDGFFACSADADLDSRLDDSQLRELSDSSANGPLMVQCLLARGSAAPEPLPPLRSGPAGGGGAAAPGAAASGQRQQRAVEQELQQMLAENDAAAATSDAIRKVLGRSTTAAQQELLLEVASHEQLEMEQQMACITQQVKRLQSCMMLLLFNILTRKQLALQHIHAYPFVIEAISLCEALDDLGW